MPSHIGPLVYKSKSIIFYLFFASISTAKPPGQEPGGVTGGALPFGRGAVQFCFFLGGLASSMATMPRTLKAMTMMKAEV